MADKESILIVDDYEVNIDMLEAILESLEYNVYSAMSAAEATEILNDSDKRPHLVLLDIMMPDVNGFEFCEMLKENPHTRDIPVIFVSAAESDEEREKAFESGGVDFIRKPFDITEIKTRVSTHLNIYNLRRELEDNNRKLNHVISEQSRRIMDEKKRILKSIASLSSDKSDVDDYLVARNSRMLAQALNFTDKYENKLSESFVESVEIGSLIRHIDVKIFDVIFTENDDNESVKTARDIVYGFNSDDDSDNDSVSYKIVRIIDTFAKLSSEYDREEALDKLREADGLDDYILEMFYKIEKQIKS